MGYEEVPAVAIVALFVRLCPTENPQQLYTGRARKIEDTMNGVFFYSNGGHPAGPF